MYFRCTQIAIGEDECEYFVREVNIIAQDEQEGFAKALLTLGVDEDEIESKSTDCNGTKFTTTYSDGYFDFHEIDGDDIIAKVKEIVASDDSQRIIDLTSGIF